MEIAGITQRVAREWPEDGGGCGRMTPMRALVIAAALLAQDAATAAERAAFDDLTALAALAAQPITRPAP